jgi:hypothetical protein
VARLCFSRKEDGAFWVTSFSISVGSQARNSCLTNSEVEILAAARGRLHLTSCPKSGASSEDITYRIAEWQEDRLSTVTQQMFNLLASMKDQTAHDTFNVDRFKASSDKLERDRVDIVKELAALFDSCAHLLPQLLHATAVYLLVPPEGCNCQ